MTTGIGSTSAGLTATASRVTFKTRLSYFKIIKQDLEIALIELKDGGMWHLEAGTLNF